MENNQKDPERPAPDKKSPNMGGNSNLVWYLVGVGILIMFVVSLMGPKARVAIRYGELVQLIEQGSPQRNPEASIEVDEGSGEKMLRVRYSRLDKLKIGPNKITGTVTRQVLAPKDKAGEPASDVRFHTARQGLDNDNNALVNLLQANGFDRFTGEEPPSGLINYAPMLVFLLVIIMLFIFMMRRLGGAGGAMAFGRSRGKLFAQEDIGITFGDVAGIDEAVDELREVVAFLKTPEKFRSLGGRIPKGVLLVGPPGTGKTLLARAVAGEADVPFFSLSGSDFVEMFVGVGAARVRDMFQQAQGKSPCIIFIDELDALGKTRGTSVVGGHDEREQTLNALLVEMDGFSANSGVIVLAATNRPETLDPALLRPGRFDRHVLVDRPDVRGREAILKVHLQNIKLDEAVDPKKLAGITSGFVGADLANLVNEAALLAARENKKAVSMAEFTEGVERVTAGLEKRQRIIHDDEKQRVAYHESGHALVAYSLPNTDPVHKVSIIPRGLAALGYTLQRPEGDRYLMTQVELESRIQVLLAGTVAEEMIFEDVSTGAQNDLQRATEIARSMVMDFGMSQLGRVTFREGPQSPMLGDSSETIRRREHSEHTAREIDEEIRRIIDQGLDRVRHILEARHDALVALAKRLIDQEVINSPDLEEVIEANSPSPMLVPGTTDAAKRPPATRKPILDTKRESGPSAAGSDGA